MISLQKSNIYGDFGATNQSRGKLMLIILGILWMLHLLFSFFCVYKYIKNYNRDEIIKRNPYHISLIILILLILFELIPLSLFIIIGSGTYTDKILIILHQIIHDSIITIILYLFLFKVYILWYEIGFQKACINIEWKGHIDPEYKNKNNKFDQLFIKYHHQNKYKKYVISFVILPMIIASISLIIITMLVCTDNNYSKVLLYIVIVIILYCIPIIFSIVFWVYTPKFDDIFCIRKEVKRLIIIISLFIFGLLILIAVHEYTNIPVGIINVIYSIIMTSIAIYSSTIKVLKENNILNKSKEKRKDYKFELQPININMHDLMDTVLSHNIGFNLFMHHLSKEFAMENLLCIIECTQYKQYIRQKILTAYLRHSKPDLNEQFTPHSGIISIDTEHDSMTTKTDTSISSINRAAKILVADISNVSASTNDTNERDTLKQSDSLGNIHDKWNEIKNIEFIQFPDCIPKSYIVHSNTNIYKKMKKLRDKYIAINSPFEVNISGYLRKKILKKMNKKISKIDLLYLFDDIVKSLKKLLIDSFGRFRLTKDYIKLQKLGIFADIM